MTDTCSIDLKWHGLDLFAEVYLGVDGDEASVESAYVVCPDQRNLTIDLAHEEALERELIETARLQQGDEDDRADNYDRAK